MTIITALPPIHLRTTETDLSGWLGQAMPGDVLEYHQGFLVLDADPAADRMGSTDRRELRRVAHRAWWAAEQGLVHLVQRRLGPDAFAYLAIARPRPCFGRQSLSALLALEAA